MKQGKKMSECHQKFMNEDSNHVNQRVFLQSTLVLCSEPSIA